MNIWTWTFAYVAFPFSTVWTLARQAVQAVSLQQKRASHEEAETQGKMGMIQRELRGNHGHDKTMKTCCRSMEVEGTVFSGSVQTL